MSYGTHTFWDIYLYGLNPICGTVLVILAFAVFMVATRDHPERRLFWVVTILAVAFLTYCFAAWNEGRMAIGSLELIEEGVDLFRIRESQAMLMRVQMMFMAQAGLAVAIALGLLWWPIRPRDQTT